MSGEGEMWEHREDAGSVDASTVDVGPGDAGAVESGPSRVGGVDVPGTTAVPEVPGERSDPIPSAPPPTARGVALPEPLRASPRAVPWEGFYNARDLGGLPTRDGGETLRGAFVRSADLRFATAAGLDAAAAAGIRTVLDLRNDFETRREPRSEYEAQANAHRVPPVPEAELPNGMFAVRVPLDNTVDLAFWERMQAERRLGNPRFFRPVIEQQPERVVAALRAVAAAPGGVVFHCAVGRDRTGLIAFALLTLADVTADAIADDYAHSADELTPFFARLEFPDPKHRIDESLAEIGLTLRDSVHEELDGFDPWAALVDAGMTEAELVGLRRRLRGE